MLSFVDMQHQFQNCSVQPEICHATAYLQCGMQSYVTQFTCQSWHCVADSGLTHEEAERRLLASGPNKVGIGKPQSLLSLTANALLQPFNLLMVVVAVVTISPPNGDWKTFTMVMVSSGFDQHDMCSIWCFLSVWVHCLRPGFCCIASRSEEHISNMANFTSGALCFLHDPICYSC